MKRIGSFFGSIIKFIQIVIGIFTGLTGFWILFSKLSIEHEVPLPPALDAPQRLVPTRGGKVNCYFDETGEGQPLVLVHSVNAAASAYEMKPLFDYYRGRRPVYAIDLPGYGFSARDKREYTPQLFANSLYDFLKDTLQEPADVITLSLGSEFVARTALTYQEVIRTVAMLSPTGFTFKPREIAAETMRNAQRRHAVLAFPLWGRALFDLIATRASIHWFLSKSFVGTPPQALEDYAYATSHQPGAEHVPLHFISGTLFTPDASSVLYERLEIPALVIYDDDAYVRFDTLDRHVSNNASWQANRVAPTKGLPHWEALPATTVALDEFWAE